ncbi:helix-turn-helix transcriptional regulator [Entomospira entomophila]|uniref:Helix-turn-helix transcriptional regulator n=1 Tax=Entomospira entomophila TaxID=2719988 RepID=A0A968GAQ5_9SPIO|nr:helix-turn-helix transcriptional regulator [Entomospira entomophilus]NIZ40915.1 helix-turn-helix transcriptional regulator [Entomospira entomophilus]WDI35128.1 helix-turn-helix transcriptional regulator [Entomospira entomophilus]
MLTYGERLRLVRKHFGWTQAEAAKYFGVKQNMISRYERQEHQVPDEIKIQLHELGIDLIWLLTGEGNMLRSVHPEREIEALKKEVVALETSIDQMQAESATLAAMLKSIKSLLFQ